MGDAMLSGFELYPRWVPLSVVFIHYVRKLRGILSH